MSTLSIPQIFQNLAFYQANYLSILAQPEQYNIPVESAYVDVWPFARIELCLGDLLQLWFSEKWLIQPSERNLIELEFNFKKDPVERTNDVYLYQLTGNSFIGKNKSKAWSCSQQQDLELNVNSLLRHLFEYKAISGLTHFQKIPHHPLGIIS